MAGKQQAGKRTAIRRAEGNLTMAAGQQMSKKKNDRSHPPIWLAAGGGRGRDDKSPCRCYILGPRALHSTRRCDVAWERRSDNDG